MVFIALAGAFIGVAPAQQVRIERLPLYGSPGGRPQSKTWRFAGGTVLTDTTFYTSKTSDLTVGRTYLNGRLLPWETADYTDLFLVEHGTGTVVARGGRTIRLRAGDFILSPRGVTFEERNPHEHIHFYASFEQQKGLAPKAPASMRRLRPLDLSPRDFVRKGGFLRHTYYEGRGGVLVEAVRYPDHFADTGFRGASESSLMFVVTGSGVISDDEGTTISIKPRTAILIPKHARYRRSVNGLYVITVTFDRQ